MSTLEMARIQYVEACKAHTIAWDRQTDAWNSLVRCAAEADMGSVGAAWLALDRATAEVSRKIEDSRTVSGDLGCLYQRLQAARGDIGSHICRSVSEV